MGPDSITWTGVRPSRDLASGPAHPHGTRVPLRDKLASVDRHADKTLAFLHAFIDEYWDELRVMAQGRLVRGHFQWQDRNYKEWDADRLLAETSEELADAINYLTERFEKLSAPRSGAS